MFLQYFSREHNVLRAEGVDLELLAQKVGTPAYVYSSRAITDAFDAFKKGLKGKDDLVCVSVKANGNLSLLNLLARRGAGFDIVTGGELKRVLAAGGDRRKIVFSGVGKTDEEIILGLEAGIHSFNVESEQELQRVNELAAQKGLRTKVSFRINPDVDVDIHQHIRTGRDDHKFGIPLEQAFALCSNLSRYPSVELCGLDCHIGSGISDLTAFEEAFLRLRDIALRVKGMVPTLTSLDVGGGLAAHYTDEDIPSIESYMKVVQRTLGGLGMQLVVEPGKSIFGDAAVLLTRVLYTKQTASKSFVIVDAGFTDLIRPMLYDAYHEIAPVTLNASRGKEIVDVVGPICETGDHMARNRELQKLQRGDLLAIATAGAYGASEASNYNTRPKAVEVLVDGSSWKVVRPRETIESLYELELACVKE